jgi:hypothetical protein
MRPVTEHNGIYFGGARGLSAHFAVITTTGNQGWVGRKPADFPRFETHFLAVEPQQLFIAVVFEAGADLLHAKGVVDVGGRNVAYEHRARQIEEVTDFGGCVSMGREALGGALGHLVAPVARRAIPRRYVHKNTLD